MLQEDEMGAHITSHPSMLIIDVSVSVKDFAGVTITFKTSEVNCRTLSKVLGYFLVWEGHFDQMALTVLFLVPKFLKIEVCLRVKKNWPNF